jgi:dipeptide/tripeptide permease
MPLYNRLSLLVSLALAGLALSSLVDLPVASLYLVVLGSPLGFDLSSRWLLMGLLVALICAGTNAVLRTHPRIRLGTIGEMAPFWVLPGLLTLALAVLLYRAPNMLIWLGELAVAAALLPLVILAEHRIVDPRDRYHSRARLGLNLVAYATALVLFTLIYGVRARSLLSASAMVLAGGLLALELLRGLKIEVTQKWIYALVTGLILGEITWALNYWWMGALPGGIFLFLVFYLVSGLAQQHLGGRLTRRVALEYGVAALLCLGLIVRYAALLR